MPGKILVIISCSGGKRNDEGSSGCRWVKENSAVGRLSRDKAAALLDCRRSLPGNYPKKFHHKEEKDLGGNREGTVPLMPAIERYTGKLYGEIDSSLWKRLKGREDSMEVVIVSALYGLLTPWEAIRNYDLAMDEAYGKRFQLWRWWRNQGLGGMLCEFVDRSGASTVHDFLGGPYRNISRGLKAQASSKFRLIPHQYPGEGSGSIYHRGRDVRKLMEKTLGDGS